MKYEMISHISLKLQSKINCIFRKSPAPGFITKEYIVAHTNLKFNFKLEPALHFSALSTKLFAYCVKLF